MGNKSSNTIKTHTFNGRRYSIEKVKSIEGVTDVPGEPDPYTMLILSGNNFIAFHSAFHESLEAAGFCDACLHKKDGTPNTIEAARLIWRLGYRSS